MDVNTEEWGPLILPILANIPLYVQSVGTNSGHVSVCALLSVFWE